MPGGSSFFGLLTCNSLSFVAQIRIMSDNQSAPQLHDMGLNQFGAIIKG